MTDQVRECQVCGKRSPPMPRHHAWCACASRRANKKWIRAYAFAVKTPAPPRVSWWSRLWRWIASVMGRGIA